MDLPQSIRKIVHGHTVVPFPKIKENPATTERPVWKAFKKPSWLVKTDSHLSQNCKKIFDRCAKNEETYKRCTKAELAKTFLKTRIEIETEMLELFSFLETVDIPAKMNLLDKFNQKIISGEITTVEQMKAFLSKAEELADCIKLYLLKNEYSENFMREISFDVFEQGFNRRTQEEIKRSYPNYFS